MPELQHYGVKGMRWGVRKQLRPSPKQEVKKLTNKEIQEKLERARLESEYISMRSPNLSSIRSKINSLPSQLTAMLITTAIVTPVAAYGRAQVTKALPKIGNFVISKLRR